MRSANRPEPERRRTRKVRRGEPGRPRHSRPLRRSRLFMMKSSRERVLKRLIHIEFLASIVLLGLEAYWQYGG